MTTTLPPALAERLAAAGQQHLIQHAATLPAAAAAEFCQQLTGIDWPRVAQLTQAAIQNATVTAGSVAKAEVHPPRDLVRLPQAPADHARWNEAWERGWEALRSGKVGVIVVAGGQGTRLGSSSPKGMYPIGPLSQAPLFQLFCEQLRTWRRRAGCAIPYAVMTSSATHAETLAFFESQSWYGLPPEDLRLFQQGHMPAVDASTGAALLSAPGQLALSPDGHGGMLAAMAHAEILQDWASRGIETLFYHQVDNPSTPLCDPAFLGWHLLRQSEVSTKVVAKRDAQEKMGVLVEVGGVTQIIEYSDLPQELAEQLDERGRLRIWCGNTAMHIFQREFLERALVDDRALPFHTARKAVPYLDATAVLQTPQQPNAFKFERFMFDTLPWAKTALVVEGSRADEFNPVKNGQGQDSPETARTALQAMYRRWLRAAGVSIGDDVPVEISPLVAVTAEDLLNQFPAGTAITEPLHLTPERLQQFQS